VDNDSPPSPDDRGAKGAVAERTGSRTLAAVLLAAGKGKRMRSSRPKVLHEVAGRPGLWWVAKAAMAARPTRLIVVVGYGKDEVEEAVRSWDLPVELVFVDQGETLGTGHAVSVAERAVGNVDEVLVMAGDDPLPMGEHVRSVLRRLRRTGSAASILTTVVDDPTGYGRVVRAGGDLVEIAEESDARPEVRKVHEISTVVYAFRREDLYRALPRVGRENRQSEYYLPDVLGVLIEKGERIPVVTADFGGVWVGLNSRATLATLSRMIRARIVDGHMDRGVTFVDPDTAYVDVDVRIGRDTVIHPMTFLHGRTRIGKGASIGPGTRLVDCTVGDGADVAFSVARQSRIGPRALVGPYASLRPGTVLEEGSKAGTFVEMKNTRVGRGSKVPHLAYMGDARIGRGVNVGAGTITCNYDGYEKHPTVIGDEAFVGSDTMLVAPVKLGKRSWTAAGSAITEDVPVGALAVERAKQRVIRGYDDRQRASHQGRAPGSKRHEDPAERKGGRGRA
jgi:bifunctional UDP-N-acetylglucosamine pyrophosphorylase/glucosamine-1-phosphate N-acetyltransferase